MSRPPYRAFIDVSGTHIIWRRVNPDGTPTSLETSPMELAEIAGEFSSAIINGDTWVIDFFMALRTNGKANLRGEA